MFELGGQRPILGHRRPTVAQDFDLLAAGIDHRLDGEKHARTQDRAIAGNAEIIRSILGGEAGARRDIVLLNAAAALLVGGKVERMEEGLQRAAESVDSGAAQGKLDALVKFTQQGSAG